MNAMRSRAPVEAPLKKYMVIIQKPKRLFASIFLFLTLLLGTGVIYSVLTPSVHAQTTGSSGAPTPTPPGTTNNANANTPPVATDRQSLLGKVFGSIVTFSLESISFALMVIGVFVMTICGMILYFAGVILNLAINYSILDMSSIVNSIPGITAAWKVFRDLANMSFIFVISYVAISTILGTSGRLSKEIIIRVLVVALLLNFSLFFTKVMVDASNILAAQFYKAMVPDSTGSINGGVSWALMRSMALTTTYSLNQGNNSALQGPQDVTVGTIFKQALDSVTSLKDPQKGAIVTVLSSVFFLIAAVVFFAGAILLIIRFVVLVLLMAISPLAYIAMVIPNAGKYASQWWENLTKHLIFAPAYMMMLWIVLSIINSQQYVAGVARTSGTQGDQLGAMGVALANGGSAVSVILNFIIIIVMMVAAIVIAQTLGIQGTKAATNFSQNLTGKLATRLTGTQMLNRLARENKLPFATSAFAKSRAGQYMRQLTQKATGLAADRKFGAYASVNEVEERKKKEYQQRVAGAKELEARAELVQSAKQVEALREKQKSAKLSKEEEEMLGIALAKLQTAAVGLSKSQIDNISSKVLKQEDVVAALSTTQMEWIGESEKFSATEKSEIGKARRAPYEAAAKTIAANASKTQAELQEEDPATGKTFADGLLQARKTLRGITLAELERMPAELVQQAGFAQGLSYDQVSSLYKSNKIAAWQKQTVKESRQSSLSSMGEDLEKIQEKEQEAWAAGKTLQEYDENLFKRYKQLQLAVQAVAPAELKEFDPEKILSNPRLASLFSNEQADEIDKSDLSSNTKGAIREARLSRFRNILDSTTYATLPPGALNDARKDMNKIGAKWLNRLGAPALTSDRMLETYSPQMLIRMAQADLASSDMQAIRTAVANKAASGTATPNVVATNNWLNTPRGLEQFS